jgi:hypothetical protein
MHTQYRPYTEKTIFLLDRIINDLVMSEEVALPMPWDDLRVTLRILSN